MNVLVQVIERHFMRHLYTIVPEISEKEMREMVKADEREERVKVKIIADIGTFGTSLSLLDTII